MFTWLHSLAFKDHFAFTFIKLHTNMIAFFISSFLQHSLDMVEGPACPLNCLACTFISKSLTLFRILYAFTLIIMHLYSLCLACKRNVYE